MTIRMNPAHDTVNPPGQRPTQEPTMAAELTDQQYLLQLAEHYKDSPVPEIRAHHARLQAIAATLASPPPAQGEPVAYVNGDELDNLLTDRTATIQGVKSGNRATPLFAHPPLSAEASDDLIQVRKPRNREEVDHLLRIAGFLAKDINRMLDEAFPSAEKAQQPANIEQSIKDIELFHEKEQPNDNELPGMWEHADFTGGADDCVPAQQAASAGATQDEIVMALEGLCEFNEAAGMPTDRARPRHRRHP